MKGIVITHRGIEDVAAEEIEELIEKKSAENNTTLIFEVNGKADLMKLSYLGRSFIKVLEYEANITIGENFLADLEKACERIKVLDTFRVKCAIIKNEKVKSQELEPKIGSFVLKKNNSKVDLMKPKTIVYIYIYEEECYIGLDFAGQDLSKRDYKIFVHPASLKGNLAYALLRIAGYDKDKKILDPFCGCGTIPIEAGLFSSGMSHNYFSKEKFLFAKTEGMENTYRRFDNYKTDKFEIYGYDMQLKHIMAARKNAKIAGILDCLTLSKCELSWIDTKFDEGYFDMIVTDPPLFSKNIEEKKYCELMKEFFYQMEYLVHSKGNITMITNDKSFELMRKEAAKYKFSPSETHEVEAGLEHYIIVKFIKQ